MNKEEKACFFALLERLVDEVAGLRSCIEELNELVMAEHQKEQEEDDK